MKRYIQSFILNSVLIFDVHKCIWMMIICLVFPICSIHSICGLPNMAGLCYICIIGKSLSLCLPYGKSWCACLRILLKKNIFFTQDLLLDLVYMLTVITEMMKKLCFKKVIKPDNLSYE